MSSHERLPSNITKTGSCAHSRFGGGAARRQAHLTQGSSRRLGWRQRSRRAVVACARARRSTGGANVSLPQIGNQLSRISTGGSGVELRPLAMTRWKLQSRPRS